MTDVRGVLEAFSGLRVLVIGDVMLDVYRDGTASRICREGPVPVVRVRQRSDCPGGAANTAVNLRRLGAQVDLVSVVGDDTVGRVVHHELEGTGVRTGLTFEPGRSTLALQRILVGGQLVARFDEGTTVAAGAAAEEALLAEVARRFVLADAVIVSDYDCGVCTPATIDLLARLQRSSPRLVVVDSKRPAAFRHVRPTAVKPNWSEALALLGSGELDGITERADGIADHGETILELTGAQIAAVTLDAEGALLFERGRPPHRTFARRAPSTTAVGAGDTFVAALTLALAAGGHTPGAGELASAAAAVVVARGHTSWCSAADLEAELLGTDKKIGPDHLAEVVACHRRAGRRIVFTNGCFDLLHRGHITYLNRAKTLGDVLLVGVNSDSSVRGLKGEGRPINSLDDRMHVLSALSCVDGVIAFDGSMPADLLVAIRPDLYVKGGDYSVDSLPEAPLVARLGTAVKFLPFMHDRSTTGIIERIVEGDRLTSEPGGG